MYPWQLKPWKMKVGKKVDIGMGHHHDKFCVTPY